MSLLLLACSENGDSQTVADQFVRAYFVEDNMAEVVKLASGSAKTKLERYLREIEASGTTAAAEDKPHVKTTLRETQPISENDVRYVYRVTAEESGIDPITAELWLSKEGGTWYVSKFVQQQ
jgi:hypothetical protein